MDASLQDIVINSKAPTSNGVQIVQVEKYKNKEEALPMVDIKPNLEILLKEHKMKDLCHSLITLGSSLDEENVLEFLFKLPNSLNKAAMKGMEKVEEYEEFQEVIQNHIQIDSLSDKARALFFFHTLILSTTTYTY